MILNQKDINAEKISKIIKSIFIYSTDTIYGIGCDANNKKLVEKIRELKGRDKKPFSIIAPSKEYILKNCITTKKEIQKYLPGQYTLVLRKRDKDFLKHVSNTDRIGVRIPNHPITEILQKTEKPIITTSVNLSGKKPATTPDEIKQKIKDSVDYIIKNGTLSGKPSTIVIDGKEIKR